MTTHAIFVSHFEDDEADQINMVFFPMWSDSGKSRHEFINEVFKSGLATVKVKTGTNDKESQKKRRALEMAMRLQGQDGYNKLLETIYERASVEEFLAFCIAEDINPEEFKQRYAMKMPDKSSWSLTVLGFLDESLRDGDYHELDLLRVAAEKKGIVKDDKDWQNVRVIASRNNMTSDRRGYWRKQ